MLCGMKRLFPVFGSAVFLCLCLTAHAAGDFAGGDTLLDTPFDKWRLNGLTAYAIIRVVGQAYAALRAGGGLKGIYNALVYGENAPRALLADYGHELGLNPKAVAEQKAINEQKLSEQKSPTP